MKRANVRTLPSFEVGDRCCKNCRRWTPSRPREIAYAGGCLADPGSKTSAKLPACVSWTEFPARGA